MTKQHFYRRAIAILIVLTCGIALLPAGNAHAALVSQFTFENDTLSTPGASVTDDGPSGNTGTLQGNAVVIDDGSYRGKVMSLDGSGDYSNHPDSASLDISGNAIALTGWVKLDTLAGRIAFMEKDGQTDNAYAYEIDNNSNPHVSPVRR